MDDYLKDNGLKMGRGKIVDATLINASSTTKIQDKYSTNKDNPWFFSQSAFS